MVNHSKGNPSWVPLFSTEDFRPYHELGCAVIRQAVQDCVDGILPYGSLRNFLKDTTWVQCLNVDTDKVLEITERRLYEKEKRRKNRSKKEREAEG